jgi:fluoride exporter
MIVNILLVGFGGALGSIARFLSVYAVSRAVPDGFPLGTLVVNVTGCFAMGIIFGLSHRFDWLTPEWRFFLATGFCGGFTTFSAFAYESLILLQHRDYWSFALNAGLSFALCLAAVLLGLVITRG